MRLRLLVVLALASIAALASCERPRFRIGEGCEVNSDCDAPLVCALGACRRQCVDSRDCGAGLRCLVVDPALGGGCQIDDEVECTLTSECRRGPGTEQLVCQNGTCTTQCREDRDCPLGARCTEDAAGVLGCFETSTELCLYNSDCPAEMICDRDQVCRYECLDHVDCTPPRRCVNHLCELPDGG